ncbi:MAG: hypothetical protein OHK0017_06930 [Patescibacteria group bacterium]
MFYDFITEADLGQHVLLTYQSDEIIQYGQVCALPLRNQSVLGICLSNFKQELNESEQGSISSNSFKVKSVREIFPIILNKHQLDVITNAGKFSWNKPGSIVKANLQPIKENLTKIKKNVAKYQNLINLNNYEMSTSPTQSIKTSIRASNERKFSTFYGNDLVLRIMYLIRNEVENNAKTHKQIMILFPDTQTLEMIKQKVNLLLSNEGTLNDAIKIFTYHSNNSVKDNNITIMQMLQNGLNESSNKTQIIFSTRSGLFLPFSQLGHLVLVNEANNNYIQEQNELYFDARDMSFLLSQIWGSGYTWISELPSVRSTSFQTNLNIFENIESGQNSLNYGLSFHEKNITADETDLFSQATLDLINSNENSKILLIHPRKGSFRLTKCAHCGYLWQCPNCEAPLTAYRNSVKDLDLICNHCQTNFEYPAECPECHKSEISSFLSGIEQLNQYLTTTYPEYQIIPYTGQANNSDISSLYSQSREKDGKLIYTTTKIFDAQLPYSSFDLVVFVQAQNLLSGTDYLSTEESIYSIFSLILQFNLSADNYQFHPPYLIFDTPYPELPFFQKFRSVIQNTKDYKSTVNAYLTFINEEKDLRERFALPPFFNTLLLTIQDKNHQKAREKIMSLHQFLAEKISKWPELSLTPPYPAKLIKRKGYFSYHILIKYPKKFNHLNDFYKEVEYTLRESRVQTRLNPRHLF